MWNEDRELRYLEQPLRGLCSGLSSYEGYKRKGGEAGERELKTNRRTFGVYNLERFKASLLRKWAKRRGAGGKHEALPIRF